MIGGSASFCEGREDNRGGKKQNKAQGVFPSAIMTAGVSLTAGEYSIRRDRCRAQVPPE